MRGSFSPARSIAARISFRSGVSANLTYTRVPPLKSTPNGMPCQKKIESNPAMLKINEKARKYHFLPRKSMLELRKNSTAYPLYAQRFPALVAAEDAVENHARYKDRGEQVRRKTEAQRDSKPAHRAGPEQEQNDR